jgi:hypothetical protein
MVVSTGSTITQHSTVTSFSGGSIFSGVPDYNAVAGASPAGNGRKFSLTINGVTYNSFTSEFRQVMVDSTRSGGAWNGFTITAFNGKSAAFNSSGVAQTTTGSFGPSGNLADGDILFQAGYDNSVGWLVGLFVSSFGGDNSELATYSGVPQSGNSINGFQIGQTDPDRIFTYTNNLSIPVTLTGADPFDGTVVSGSGGTAVVSATDSTDGSFSLTGTISGNDGSGQPFALVSVNNGTGSLNTSDYTGTFSVRAF